MSWDLFDLLNYCIVVSACMIRQNMESLDRITSSAYNCCAISSQQLWADKDAVITDSIRITLPATGVAIFGSGV